MLKEQQMIKEASSIYKVMCGSHNEERILAACLKKQSLACTQDIQSIW